MIRTRKEAHERFIPVMREKTLILLGEEVEKARPERIFEAGTSLGTSGAWALASSGKAHLTTVEIDLDTAERAKENFRLLGMSGRVDILVDDCLNVAKLTDDTFDFAIIDSSKSHYLELFQLLEKHLTKGATVFADDVGFHDKLSQSEPAHKHRTIVNNMKSFLAYVSDTERFESRFLSVEDGIAIIKIK